MGGAGVGACKPAGQRGKHPGPPPAGLLAAAGGHGGERPPGSAIADEPNLHPGPIKVIQAC